MYSMQQKLLHYIDSRSLTNVLLCSIVFVVLLSCCIINTSISIFEQQAMAQTKTTTSTSHQGQNQTGQIISNKILEVRLLADNLANRLNKTATILQVTSKLPQVSNVSSANLISHVLHGIPSNADLPKRSVAKEIVTADGDVPVVFFNMPNGDFILKNHISINKTSQQITLRLENSSWEQLTLITHF